MIKSWSGMQSWTLLGGDHNQDEGMYKRREKEVNRLNHDPVCPLESLGSATGRGLSPPLR